MFMPGAKDWPGLSRSRTKQPKTKCAGEVGGGELTLYAVTGAIQQRREGSQPTFSWCDRHNAPTDTALARQTRFIEPVTTGLVHTSCGHHSEGVVAHAGIDNLLAGNR